MCIKFIYSKQDANGMYITNLYSALKKFLTLIIFIHEDNFRIVQERSATSS